MGQYKKLIKNTLVMTIGQFSSKVLSFLLVPLYTSLLSTAEYGTYDLLVTTVTLLTPLLTLTISEGVMRFCLDEKYDPKEILTIGIVVVALGSGVLAISYPIIRHIPAISDYYVWLLLFFTSSNIHLVLTQFLKGINKVKLYATCGVISTAITLVLNIMFLVVFKLGIVGYMLAYILGHSLIIFYILIRIKITKWIINPLKISKQTIKNILKYSCPMIPNSICWWISNSSDKYMVNGLVSTAALGIYSVSYKIPNMMAIFTTIFNSAFQISAVENFGDENSKKFYGNIYQLFSSCNVLVATMLILGSKLLAKLLYQNDFFIAWKASSILIMAFMFNSLAGLLGSVYTSAKKTSMLFYSTIIAALVNILLNITLIPKIGIIGAAIATLISYVCIWIIRLVHSRKILKFKVNYVQNIVSYALMSVEIIMMLSGSYIGAICIAVTIITINIIYILKSKLINKYLKNNRN